MNFQLVDRCELRNPAEISRLGQIAKEILVSAEKQDFL